MDRNKLEVFVRIVTAGGVNAAARELGLPKSSVSRALHVFEKGIGVEPICHDWRGSLSGHCRLYLSYLQ